MIKVVKLGGSIYSGIELKSFDEDGNESWNVPEDLNEFKTVAIDTVNWVVGDKIKKAVENNITLLNAANSKAIVLLAKVVNTLNPDLSVLTDKEKTAYDVISLLADNGYSNSELLNSSVNTISECVQQAPSLITTINDATSHEEVIKILNTL